MRCKVSVEPICMPMQKLRISGGDQLNLLLLSAASLAACTQEEVNEVFSVAKEAQKIWAKTPLFKRAEILHKVATLLRENAQPVADCLVKEIAKPAKESLTEVRWAR